MIAALLLLLSAVAYRIVTGLLITSGTTWPSNFAPYAALALCAAAYFPTRLKFTLPLIALFVSDVILNSYYNFPLLDPRIVCHYVALAGVGLLGWSLQNRASLVTMLAGSVAGSTIFYLITNTFSWLTDPGYVKNAAGWWQALTVGLPQYTPTWMFFRNSVVSDLLFTLLFVLCMSFGRSAERSRVSSAVPRAA